MTIRFLTVAQAEFDEAVAWYDGVSPDLGNAFLVEVTKTFQRIEQFPLAWHPLAPNIRRCRLARFPYGIVYVPEGEDQLVIAFAHLHRAPLYWDNRLGTDVF